jgi:hypothetical protein
MKALAASSLAIILLTAAAVAAHAGASAGAESFDFLLFDPSARAAGLGGAYTALAADSNALFYNPAGLGRIKANEVTFMHNQYVEGLTQEHVGLATPRGWGLSLNYLDFGGIPRTRLDAPGGGIGSAGMTDLAIGGGYGQALSESLSVGAGAKFVRETVDNVSAGGFAVDAGVLAAVASLPGLSLGAAVLNIGPAVRFQSRSENLPLLGRAGAAMRFRVNTTINTVTFDATKARTDEVRFGFGAETVIENLLALRLGFSARNDAGLGLTGGVGLVWKSLAVDFAIAPYGDLGFANRLSLTLRWGNKNRPGSLRAERKAPAPVDNESLRAIRVSEQLGRNAFDDEDFAGAKNLFAKAIRAASAAGVKDPVVADAYAGMGRCLLEEGKVDDAAKFFRAFEEGGGAETRRLVEEELETLRPEPAPIGL